jgi:hypothetical protein
MSENLDGLAHKRYEDFLIKLPRAKADLFNVYCTEIPLMHSLGLYDDKLYVSEFCLDADSSRVPSYELAVGGIGYRTFIGEIQALLRDGTPLFGSGPSRIATDLK